MLRRVTPIIGTVASLALALAPAVARAQVNIDQGKPASEIFSSVCTACHKTPRGLAVGKNSLMLSSFLREHYTASNDQASALAAYVLGAGGTEPAPKQKPEAEHARAEEPKPGEPKTAAHGSVRAAAKPEDDRRPKQQEATREERPAPQSAEKHEPVPETASREAKPQAADAAPAAVPVSAAPARPPAATAGPISTEPANPAMKPEVAPTASATAPAGEQSSEGAAVPRDNIPD